jgi:hypothetical protein
MPYVFADLLFFHARYIESSFGVAIVVLRHRLLLGEHDVCSAVSICLVVCEGFLRCFRMTLKIASRPSTPDYLVGSVLAIFS